MDTALIQEELKQRIQQSLLIPPDIQEKLFNMIHFPGAGVELEKLITYIHFVTELPFQKVNHDILDINRARQILDKNHYGLQIVKDRVLEYLSVLILQSQQAPVGLGSQKINVSHAPILAFIGLVGTGKTSIAYSIADTLGRPIIRIPFGGLGDASQLRGQSRIKPEAEPGLIIKAIKTAQVSNPVILLDEVDRVAEGGRVDIMGVLVELLDPQQNHAFVDHYLDFPYDLSQVLFIATANNTTNIATAVMDRLEPIQMPAYSDEEKVVIGQRYLLPRAMKEAGIDSQNVTIKEDVWPLIIRPLGFDAGIRSLSRTLQGICRKVARQVVEGNTGPFTLTEENIGGYLPN